MINQKIYKKKSYYFILFKNKHKKIIIKLQTLQQIKQQTIKRKKVN